MATGHWVMYLNAGDLFVNASVLRNIFADDPDTQILYGDTLCTYQGTSKAISGKTFIHAAKADGLLSPVCIDRAGCGSAFSL